MSTVPLMSAAIPVPDPPPETSTDTDGATRAYSSAHAWATLTMVSEPVFWMTVFSACFWREQPTVNNDSDDECGENGFQHILRINFDKGTPDRLMTGRPR